MPNRQPLFISISKIYGWQHWMPLSCLNRCYKNITFNFFFSCSKLRKSIVVHMCMHFLVNSVEFFINLLASLSSLNSVLLDTTTTCAKLLKNHGLAANNHMHFYGWKMLWQNFKKNSKSEIFHNCAIFLSLQTNKTKTSYPNLNNLNPNHY